MPSLGLRVNLDPDGAIDPVQVELLEGVAAFGSIAAAAREMNISYKHAWDLIAAIDKLFGNRLVTGQVGGQQGSGTQLTPLGLVVIGRFRAIERAARLVAEQHMLALQSEIDID